MANETLAQFVILELFFPVFSFFAVLKFGGIVVEMFANLAFENNIFNSDF